MIPPTFITARDVADLTGFNSARAFLRQRAHLEAHHDFPEPMPTCLSPMKWRRDAVLAWVGAQGRFDPAPTQARPQLRLVGAEA